MDGSKKQRADDWMDERTDAQKQGRMDGQKEERMDEKQRRMDGRTQGPTGGSNDTERKETRTDEWKHEQMDERPKFRQNCLTELLAEFMVESSPWNQT